MTPKQMRDMKIEVIDFIDMLTDIKRADPEALARLHDFVKGVQYASLLRKEEADDGEIR